MSNVLSVMKVIPVSPEVNRNEIVSHAHRELIEGLDLEILKKEEEPLYYGLYAIKLFVKTADSEEGNKTLQIFEDRLVALEEVDNCEIELQTIIDY